MKRLITFILISTVSILGFSQSVFMTRNGQVSFFSKTQMENIEGTNNEVTSMIDTSKGDIVFAVLVKSFRFEKALMEEHFNENYLESTKFPKATFQGKFTNTQSINFTKDGTYTATVEGDLTMHGVKQRQTATGTITVKNGKISAVSTFTIKLADYKIERPSLVADKISETIEIRVNCQYEPKS
ncbi:MAG TPA: YceI family protein [Cyclobacteriaceae bacterium]|nr:YceI family protein [Cyclobacteriaceae bacterium]HPW60967.1 YceI family protein [Cyclobacteriaceae bacterium]